MNDSLQDQLKRGLDYQEQGELAQAAQIYQAIVAVAPDFADAHYLLGTLAQAQGNYEEALVLFERAIGLQEKGDYYRQKGHVLRRLGRFNAALSAYQAQVRLQPTVWGFLNLGRFYKKRQNWAAAKQALNQARIMAPESPRVYFELGDLFQKQGEAATIEWAYAQAEKFAFRDPDVLGALGRARQAQGYREAAEQSYLNWTRLEPLNHLAWQALGDFYLTEQTPVKAQQAYEKVLQLRDYPVAQVGLARALWEQSQSETAESVLCALSEVAQLPPLYDQLWGEIHLARGDWQRASVAYQRAFEKKWGVPLNQREELGVSPSPYPETFTDHKWQHDREQLDWLLTQPHLPASLRPLAQQLKSVFAHPKLSDVPLVLGRWQQQIFYYPACPEQPDGVLNPSLDWANLEQQYFLKQPGILWFDDFLRPQALSTLLDFLRAATIWRDYYGRSAYLGAYLDDGLHQPLILQLVVELQKALPAIFRGHPLSYIWVFKYAHHSPGIQLHADQAQINVNFWLTEDQANLSPESSGLALFDREAPLEWDFRQYNSIEGARQAERWLKAQNAQKIRIPYRQNRVVIFNSNLFHQTDQLQFKPGYKNRRMNLTLLFGKRGNKND